MLLRHFEEVSHASDELALHRALVSFAGEMDFGQVSVVVLRGTPGTPGFWGKSVGNPPPGYSEIATNREFFGRDPLMARLKSSVMPIAWDQGFYADSGCGDIWEAFAPFGYRTGLALGMRLSATDQLFLGVDRVDALPGAEIKRMRQAADLQLLAVHAQAAMTRLFAGCRRRAGGPGGRLAAVGAGRPARSVRAGASRCPPAGRARLRHRHLHSWRSGLGLSAAGGGSVGR